MIQNYLLYVEIQLEENVELEDILNTEGDSDIGYTFEVDMIYSEAKRE